MICTSLVGANNLISLSQDNEKTKDRSHGKILFPMHQRTEIHCGQLQVQVLYKYEHKYRSMLVETRSFLFAWEKAKAMERLLSINIAPIVSTRES